VPRPGARAADIVLALAVGGLGVVESWPSYIPRLEDWERFGFFGQLVPVLFSVTVAVPLLFRRRAPIAALLAILSQSVLVAGLGFDSGAAFFALLIALFSAGLYSPARTRSLVAPTALVVGITILAIMQGGLAIWMVGSATMFVAAWAAGDLLRERSLDARRLRERAVNAELEHAQEARRAVAEERVRIARELHDVVAHSVSVMVVQAEAAQRVLNTQPERASEAMSAVETTGRPGAGRDAAAAGGAPPRGRGHPRAGPAADA